MTVDMLRERGAVVETGADLWRVAPGPLHGGEFTIEPDLSNAAQFLAAALVTGGRVTVRDWPAETTQPGDALRELLPMMGGTVTWGTEGLTVTGTGAIQGIEVDLGDAPELAQVMAMLAALAQTPSRFTGIAHIRGHETDRLAALVTEINALGGGGRPPPAARERRARAPPTRGRHTSDPHPLLV